ncbi:MAG TPA: archaetidylserine decarboxylase [Planctomycetota bacterium]|nr:archaetidylserine decarboxylase [Planctomycetota bacterium]
MATPLARTSSRLFGWLADLRLPTFLRAPVYRAYARLTGADLSELRLALADHPSLGAFFIRRLKDGARVFPSDPLVLPSPVDGRVQSLCPIESGCVLQAKGRSYAVEELLGDARLAAEVQGGHAWTIYLSPRDYHRIHAPLDCTLSELTWISGSLYSVAPKVLARRPKVLSINERAVLRLQTDRGPFFLVAVGALNVGRIRVVGVEPQAPAPKPPLHFSRGAELARFEMGSTVVLLSGPGGYAPLPSLGVGDALKMGEPIGRLGA